MRDLDPILKEVWPKVRKRHFFPEMPAPLWSEQEDRVAIEMNGKQTLVSRVLVKELSEVLDPEEVLEGFLDHAVAHYLYCPWDVCTQMKLYSEAKKIVTDKAKARRAIDYFMDVVVDTHCVYEKNSPLPRIYREVRGGTIDAVMHALYQKIWGVDLGIDAYDQVSRDLSGIPYLDRRHWLESVRRFTKVVESFLDEDVRSDQLSGAISMGSHDFRQYSPEEIERGLKEFALAARSLSEFKEIVGDFETEIMQVYGTSKQHVGSGGRPVDGDILYYSKLAENYSLPIRKAPLQQSGALYPHHHNSWEIGRAFQDIDPWTSFGKIIPGITKTWERVEGQVFGREIRTPDCLILIDSSGSMTNPREALSYAVLGAACACDAYLRNGASVSVYNFSDATADGRSILPYTRERVAIYETLCLYFGGGTRPLIEDIDTLRSERMPDIFMITDMQIENLENIIQYFMQKDNRVTAVHVGENEHVQSFRRSMVLKKNVNIYALNKTEDILGIVLGRIREFFQWTP